MDTVKRHLQVLRKDEALRDVYMALARAALRYLPVKQKNSLAATSDALRGLTRTRVIQASNASTANGSDAAVRMGSAKTAVELKTSGRQQRTQHDQREGRHP